MRRLAPALAMVILIVLLLPGCTTLGGTATPEPAKDQIHVDTDFALMLGFVPHSFLEEHDVWFGNPGAIKKLYGLEHISSRDKLEQLPEEERREAMGTVAAVPVPQFTGNYFQIAPLIGWDGFMIDRAVFHEVPPPWGFSVIEDNFDETLIGGKLTEQGYEQAEYGTNNYYWKNDDMKADIRSDIGRQILAQLNRVAVLDNTIVTAPTTGIMTSILDAMTGNVTKVIDNAACRAVADSLGDVLGAVLITPDRVLKITPATEIPAFDLPAAANWGKLHDYSLFGTGYKDDGKERYWVISLYYDDKEAAEADAAELVSRLESYIFNTPLERMENIPLTSKYEVGKPVVREYSSGAALTVACRYLPETTGSSSLFTLVLQARDLLFLAPDPTPYVAK